jgi:putative phosphoribosyl transferase
MGAVGEEGVWVVNPEIARMADVTESDLAAVEARERAEVARRASRYRGGWPRTPLTGRVALIIDDGIATRSTARSACQVARALGAARVVLAMPVAPPDWQKRIGRDADELAAVATPAPFYAIGQVLRRLFPDHRRRGHRLPGTRRRARTRPAPEPAARLESAAAPEPGSATQPVPIPAGHLPGVDAEVKIEIAETARLPGRLTVPGETAGIVLFAHGSGSSRHSPRNRYVASVPHEADLGTLLFDLLTLDEELDRGNVFDIGLLARRLAAATRWLRSEPAACLPVGYFGASTGAAVALLAVAGPGADIAAVVSRGGRPDLADPALGSVRAPTLLIVGGNDEAVLGLDRRAQAELRWEDISPWCRAPPTYSKSREPSPQRPRWRAGGAG